MKVGNLIKTVKGNVAIILDSYQLSGMICVDLMFVGTGYVRTCFPAYHCKGISESRGSGAAQTLWIRGYRC